MEESCTSSHLISCTASTLESQRVTVKDIGPSVNLHIHIFALFAHALSFLCLIIWDLQRSPYKVGGREEILKILFSSLIQDSIISLSKPLLLLTPHPTTTSPGSIKPQKSLVWNSLGSERTPYICADPLTLTCAPVQVHGGGGNGTGQLGTISGFSSCLYNQSKLLKV